MTEMKKTKLDLVMCDSRYISGYGKMSDHVIYIPNSCLIPRTAPSREEWSMGGDGPSILGPTVYFSPSYREIRCPSNKLNLQVLQVWSFRTFLIEGLH